MDRTSGGALSVVKLFHVVLGPPNHRLDSYSIWVHVQRTLKHSATSPAVSVRDASLSITGSPVVCGTDAFGRDEEAGTEAHPPSAEKCATGPHHEQADEDDPRPEDASAAVISNVMATLNVKKTLLVLPATTIKGVRGGT